MTRNNSHSKYTIGSIIKWKERQRIKHNEKFLVLVIIFETRQKSIKKEDEIAYLKKFWIKRAQILAIILVLLC